MESNTNKASMDQVKEFVKRKQREDESKPLIEDDANPVDVINTNSVHVNSNTKKVWEVF